MCNHFSLPDFQPSFRAFTRPSKLTRFSSEPRCTHLVPNEPFAEPLTAWEFFSPMAAFASVEWRFPAKPLKYVGPFLHSASFEAPRRPPFLHPSIFRSRDSDARRWCGTQPPSPPVQRFMQSGSRNNSLDTISCSLRINSFRSRNDSRMIRACWSVPYFATERRNLFPEPR